MLWAALYSDEKKCPHLFITLGYTNGAGLGLKGPAHGSALGGKTNDHLNLTVPHLEGQRGRSEEHL